MFASITSAAVPSVPSFLVMPASYITISTSSVLVLLFIIIFLIIILIIIILTGVILPSYIVVFLFIIIFLVIIFVIIILVILLVSSLWLTIPGTPTIPVIIFHCGKAPASAGNHRLSFKSLRILF